MDTPATNDLISNAGDVLPAEDRRVFDAILKAIFEQRIRPGTKLGEETLAQVFGVSRGRVRRVLLSLSHQNVVDLLPHRGAYVARPSADDASDIFSSRRALEELVVRRVVECIDTRGIEILRSHVKAEAVARDKGQRPEAIRMAGEFHLLLARLSGSRIFQKIMEPLIPQSSLIVVMFGAGVTVSCSVEEHEAIVDAIEAGDHNLGCRLMTEHILQLEETLSLDTIPEDQVDLAAIFGSTRPLRT